MWIPGALIGVRNMVSRGSRRASDAADAERGDEGSSRHPRKPPLEDTDDLIADLGGHEDGSVYKPTPTINLILGADDYFTSIAIHADEALGFLTLLHQILDGHGQVSVSPEGALE